MVDVAPSRLLEHNRQPSDCSECILFQVNFTVLVAFNKVKLITIIFVLCIFAISLLYPVLLVKIFEKIESQLTTKKMYNVAVVLYIKL